jgi:hypothetical protein
MAISFDSFLIIVLTFKYLGTTLTNQNGIKVKVKIKVKLSLCLTKHHTMKTYWGSGGIVPCILDLGTRWR